MTAETTLPMSLGAESQDIRQVLRAVSAATRALAETDGRRLPTLALDGFGRRWVAPFRAAETLIRHGTAARVDRAPGRTGDLSVQRFLAEHRAGDGAGRLCYGYPVRTDPDGTVQPLVTLPVTFALAPGGGVVVRPADGARLTLNHAVVEAAGLSPTTVEAAVMPGGEQAQTLGLRLDYLLTLLGLEADAARRDMAAFDPVRRPADAGDDWQNTAILFYHRAQADEARLLADIDALADLPAPEASVFGAWMGAPPTGPAAAGPIAPLALVPLPLEAGTLLKRALGLPVALVETLPDSGKYGWIVDLIASSAAAGRRVLYVSARTPSVEHVTRALQARGGGDRPLAVPLERPVATRLPAPLLYRGTAADAADRKIHDHLLATETEIDGLREDVGMARQRLDALLAAEADCRRLAARRAPRWQPLFHDDAPLPSDPAAIAGLAERPDVEAAALVAALRGAIGEMRLRSRAEDRNGAVATLESVLGETDVARLKDAARQIGLAGQWRDARAVLAEARQQVMACPAMAVWEERFARLESEAALRARQLFGRRFGRQATPADEDAIDRLAAHLADLWSSDENGTRRAGGPAEAAPLAEVARLAEVTRQFPVWSGTAAAAARVLPLATDLFDLIVVDDADVLAPALLAPLLVRARQAVVIGALDRASPRETDAFALARSLFAAPPLRMREHRCWMPRVACFLSDAFHDGRLRILVDRQTIESRDTLTVTLGGIHWHAPAGTDGSVADSHETDEALRLLVRWHRAGVIGGRRPLTTTVVSPWPARVARLTAALQSLERDGLKGMGQVAVGTPAALRGRTTDLLVLLPGLTRAMTPERAQFQAEDPDLYHEIVGTARHGVHVVANEALAREAGGALALMLAHLPPGAVSRADAPVWQESDAEGRLAHLLRDAGMVFLEIADGFRAFTVFGGVYDLVVAPPGGGEPDAAPRPQRGAEAVLTLEPEEILHHPDRIRERLIRLV